MNVSLVISTIEMASCNVFSSQLDFEAGIELELFLFKI